MGTVEVPAGGGGRGGHCGPAHNPTAHNPTATKPWCSRFPWRFWGAAWERAL